MTEGRVARVVALGASNLTLGLQSLIATARGAWGPHVEVLAALGYGRSYGAASSIPCRKLPGILQSGLWRDLEQLPRVPTRGLITDVGNDILYGASATQILEWVAEAADRLAKHTDDVTVTGLPLERIRLLSPARYLFFRSLFFRESRVGLPDVTETATRVEAGLKRLAGDRNLPFVELPLSWYGVDPIHIKPGMWRTAWPTILLGRASEATTPALSAVEWARLHTLPPDRRWLMGIERRCSQRGRPLRNGGRLWLY